MPAPPNRVQRATCDVRHATRNLPVDSTHVFASPFFADLIFSSQIHRTFLASSTARVPVRPEMPVRLATISVLPPKRSASISQRYVPAFGQCCCFAMNQLSRSGVSCFPSLPLFSPFSSLGSQHKKCCRETGLTFSPNPLSPPRPCPSVTQTTSLPPLDAHRRSDPKLTSLPFCLIV